MQPDRDPPLTCLVVMGLDDVVVSRGWRWNMWISDASWMSELEVDGLSEL